MRVYQVYRWEHGEGPTVTFYANKAEATRAAKTFIEETDNDMDIEVSVLDLPTKKVGLIRALNGISATSAYYRAEPVASYEPKEIPDYDFDSFDIFRGVSDA
jgi:hypothetical protein